MYSYIFLTLLFTISKHYAVGDYTENTEQAQSKCIEVNVNDYKRLSCDMNYPFRSYNGSCNNKKNPGLGAARTAYQRFLCDSYCDGIEELPCTSSNDSLTSAREISLKVYDDKKNLDCHFTEALVAFGQFITHDCALEQIAGRVTCCDNGKYTSNETTHPKCASIAIPECDPVFGPAGYECMNFVRTDKNGCKPAHPVNAVTAFIDASQIYGSDNAAATGLRTLKGGKMQSDERNGKEWLPPSLTPTATCFNVTSQDPCYRAGDRRVNQNTLLTLMHTIFLRLHNYIAGKLCDNKLCPSKDERCFQEVRRIVIAIIQNILYNEYLTILLGRKYMLKHELISDDSSRDEDGYADVYSCDCDPSMSVECATAAFRGQHSAIAGIFKLYFENKKNRKNKKRCAKDYFNVTGSIELSPWMNKPEILEKGDNSIGLSRCLFAQRQEAVDENFDDQLTFLFSNGNPDGLGLDLEALDVQRARDNGVPTYCKAALECGVLKKCDCFDDIRKHIPDKLVDILYKIYNGKVYDVELMVAGMVERLVPGTLVGPTFHCILLKQFWYTKCGDRFWYEGRNQPYPFTPEQLYNLRQITMASIICQHGDGIDKIQKHAFKKISKKNRLMNCCDLPTLDFSLFQLC